MKIQSLNKNYLFVFLYIFCCLLIVIYMNGLISSKPIVSDAEQNLSMAYHLYNHGVYSISSGTTTDPIPTNYREPVPPTVTALFMALHPAIDKNATLESLHSGKYKEIIKQVDLFWILLLMIGTGALTFLLTGNKFAPFLALFLVLTYFIRFGGNFGTLFTELPGAALIICSSLMLVLASRNENLLLYFFTGLTMGILILTKAVFFYLFLVVLLYFVFMGSSEKKFKKIGLLFLGAILLVGPWLIRNYKLYDDISVTSRGGLVLHHRATMNMMTSEEIVGAVYFWGPEIYQDIVNGSSLGIEKEDLESGGRLVRLNRWLESDSLFVDLGIPELAESFYSQSRAEIQRLQVLHGTGGREASRREVYKIMQSDAEEMILSHPIRHALMSPLFLWRGIWCFPDSTIPLLGDTIQIYLHNIVNLLSYLALFGLFFYGLWKQKRLYILFSLLPVLMLLFHGALAHNPPRLSDPAIPSLLISLTVVLFYWVQKFYQQDLLKNKPDS